MQDYRLHSTAASAAFTGQGPIFLRPDQIRPSESRKSKEKSPNSIIRLAASIKKYGILEPLTVRPLFTTANVSLVYELIAGERRLRAAILAGIDKIPCLLATEKDCNREIEAILSQATDANTDFFTQAAAFHALSESFSMTQGEIARKTGLSQSAVANKLRLLHFSREEQQEILASGLTERHARALLRLQDPQMRRQTLHFIQKERRNVAETEELIDELLHRPQAKSTSFPEGGQKNATDKPLSPPIPIPMRQPSGPCPRKLALSDLTPLYNSIERVLSIFRKTGAKATCSTEEGEGSARITIQITRQTD